MAETLSTFSIISFIVAGVSLGLAILLFIYFRIPTVIGDLSGRNAKKSIARMRSSNEKSGNKSFRASETDAARGKLTSTMPGIGNQQKKTKDDAIAFVEDQMPETGLLAENKADLIGESTVLLEDTEETMLLDETPKEPAKRVGGVKLTILDEVTFIHTDEVIE